MLPTHHSLIGLKPLRLAHNKSREELASAIGVTATSYDRFENGSRRIQLDRAIVLARTLGCSVDALTVDPAAPVPTPPFDIVVSAEQDTAAAELRDWDVEQ